MSNKTLSYKGYLASIDFSIEDQCLIGRVEHIKDSIIFGAETLTELIDSFHSSIDDYLATCIQLDKQPDKPFKGSFNIRVSPQLHKDAAYAATTCGETLNQYVSKAIEYRLKSITNINLTIKTESNHKDLVKIPFENPLDWLESTPTTFTKDTFNVREH
ncbi:type II toxin-antitoxin system HicB family antitoxin [Alkalimonas collagenimarina]|uniref:Type II toxin-antitoxin system HicB family antitoxin n=1 Tax=Alkalimonas collagenimarina TaxID=400390 RepID=A0ABT9H4A9_9GAMM|nr:type II toxin-antitoxin system HicB family antitoxin [Alkalimonas collagenimarina]MDP4537745.1 type II toxin-antitoxin system HicB family antitoxin [Alkalimonas collagenimarina]